MIDRAPVENDIERFSPWEIQSALIEARDHFDHGKTDRLTVISAGNVSVSFHFGCCSGSQLEPHVVLELEFNHPGERKFPRIFSRSVFGPRSCDAHEPGRIEADVIGPWIDERTRLAIQTNEQRAEEHRRRFPSLGE